MILIFQYQMFLAYGDFFRLMRRREFDERFNYRPVIFKVFLRFFFLFQNELSPSVVVFFRMITETLDPLNTSIDTSHVDPLTALSLENPSAAKVRLRQLLRQVEKEFESVLIENVALRKELERYGGSNNNNNTHGTSTSKLRASNIFPMIRNRVVLRTATQSDDLIFSSANQHRDVIWDVQVRIMEMSFMLE